ncbi:Putative F0F1-ATPase subunit Ca2+/Mg2+ transporter [Pricia antarctica]|uniref:Putative F0F1-ATPase subunit Ca2+/Mg2+ transporter n=1 Tax=Pricia antarctica TaxID=641691 RepID=A0A1G6WW43_9FLAO|nr:AtpZ/AtpI family protein [Pricia antarctica]SDD70118.1 Putative F0F1-ATPase subunit Ca2+/Mg2+ transporter [Pricia antarctica]
MKPQKPPKEKNSTVKNVALLSGIAFEMGAIIYLAAQGGIWLDEKYQNEKRIYTAIATLIGVAISLWVVLRQIKNVKY